MYNIIFTSTNMYVYIYIFNACYLMLFKYKYIHTYILVLVIALVVAVALVVDEKLSTFVSTNCASPVFHQKHTLNLPSIPNTSLHYLTPPFNT